MGGKGGGSKGGAPKGGAPKGGAPKGGAPKGGAPKGGPKPRKSGGRVEPRRAGAQNFALFFPCPAAKFVLFFPLWSSRGILVVFERRGAQMCTFGVLGLSCASPSGPVWWGRRGLTRQSESPNVHILGSRPVFKNTTKMQREDTQREENNEFCGGRGKKERNFGRSRGRAVQGRAVPGAPNMTKRKL